MFEILVLALLSVACWIAPGNLKKTIEESFSRNPKILPPDGAKPATLTRINFIGTTLLGEFRHHKVDGEDTFIAYHFLCFIIPIIPLNCYRVIRKNGNEYYFLGRDVTDNKELLCIYANALKWVFSAITVFMVIMQFEG